MRGVYRRGNIWWYRWSHRGRQYRTSLETEDEARAIIAAREIMANPGCLVEPSEADPVERYCRWLVDHGRSRNTANSRRHLLRQLLEATGAASYARLRPDQAREWYRGEVARLHPSTAASTLQTVRHFYGWLRDEGLARVNPFDGIKAPLQRAGARKRTLTPDEARRLIDAAPDDEMRFVLFCALHAGLRKEEIVEARPEWFDLEAGLLHLQASPTWQPKDKDNRTIPLTREFREFLAGFPMLGTYCIRPDIAKGKWRYRFDFRRGWIEARTRAGLGADVRFHDLRRTFASLLVSKGVSLYKVAVWLGDGIAVVERHYAHLTPADDEINAAWE